MKEFFVTLGVMLGFSAAIYAMMGLSYLLGGWVWAVPFIVWGWFVWKCNREQKVQDGKAHQTG